MPDPNSTNPFLHGDPQGRKDICNLIATNSLAGANVTIFGVQALAKKLLGRTIPFVGPITLFLDGLAAAMNAAGEGCGKYAGE
jgi:hypothetical protein